MRKLRALWMRLRGVVALGKTEDEFSAELESHLQMHIEDNLRAGMSAQQARREAILKLGGIEQTTQAYRERGTLPLLDNLLRDVRYALRGFRRNPVFTMTVIATLTLGIGATTAVFSVVDPILFRSLPYANPDQLVSVGLTAPIIPVEFMLGGSYYDWRDHQHPFTALTSETGVESCDLTEQNAIRLNCAHAESSFLSTLGIAPVLGRSFTEEEDRPSAPKVALISYGLWQRRFGRDADVLNKTIAIDGRQTRIIGVLPRSFEMPTLEPADILVPQALDETEQRKADPGRVMYAFARLKPGLTIEQAKAELQPVFEYSLRLAPPRFRKEIHLRVRSLRDRQFQNVMLTAWLLLGSVAAVLLIACANVASLLMARAAQRGREMAVRSALGASPACLARQALTEALLLTVAGAVAGFLLAKILLRIFVAMAPEKIIYLNQAKIDLRIILFTIVISTVCGILFAFAPAVQKPNVEVLAERRSTRGISSALARQWLVATQIAVSVVLLVSGTLLLRSLWNMQTEKLGMQTKTVLTASITLGEQRYSVAAQQMEFFQQIAARLRRMPGVTALALSDSLPPGGPHHDQIYTSIAVAGRPSPAGGTGGMAAWRWVTPEYFRALNIPLLQGHGFDNEELRSTEHFVVLSKAFASRMFPKGDAIGQHLQLAFPSPINNPWYTVVGVVGNVKNSGLTGEDEPEYYRLRRDRPEDWDRSSTIIINTGAPSDIESRWIRSEIASVDPTVPVDIQTLSHRVDVMAERPRFEAVLIGFFAMTGLLMAMIGVYGVVSFLVAQRTQEIGIRLALGATRWNILRLVLWEGGRLILLGGVAGLLATLAISRALASLLFDVSPHDPATFASVILLLAAVALVAVTVPARVAMKVDPMVALRYE